MTYRRLYHPNDEIYFFANNNENKKRGNPGSINNRVQSGGKFPHKSKETEQNRNLIDLEMATTVASSTSCDKGWKVVGYSRTGSRVDVPSLQKPQPERYVDSSSRTRPVFSSSAYKIEEDFPTATLYIYIFIHTPTDRPTDRPL